jgi:hypothetical protein
MKIIKKKLSSGSNSSDEVDLDDDDLEFVVQQVMPSLNINFCKVNALLLSSYGKVDAHLLGKGLGGMPRYVLCVGMQMKDQLQVTIESELQYHIQINSFILSCKLENLVLLCQTEAAALQKIGQEYFSSEIKTKINDRLAWASKFIQSDLQHDSYLGVDGDIKRRKSVSDQSASDSNSNNNLIGLGSDFILKSMIASSVVIFCVSAGFILGRLSLKRN